MDQEDHRLLDPEVDALQLEGQVVEVLQQVAQEVDVPQLEVQAVDVLQQVQEVVVHQLEAQVVDVLQQVVREADAPQLEAQEAAVEVLQRVGLGVTCASVWMRK